MPEGPRRSSRLAANSAETKPEAAATEPVAEPAVEAASTLASIDLGDNLPSLVLQNEQGEDIDVANLTAEKGVVIFLVPKADTRESVIQLRI
ncbi:hypothetical protein EW146_g4514 [Bondarzewia mesenterica]|uniref:Alkyl hydroperoxide reductase subunit C/ Thiol specific antioxidant domain-containing protein n=1 Tax=Bondarzewia mesenterica TaxID=1095465 RepID=A0A4S4LUT9_9AGAM|nr:hypothetical protein EW146_g4514 [Bondarzewia mesenterica]